MKNLKKIIVAASLCAAIGATAIAGTLAYFTDETETLANSFTAGDVDITLTEPEWEYSGKEYEIIPGNTVAKDPTVTLSTDSVDSYVRLVVTMPQAVYEISNLNGVDNAIINFKLDGAVLPQKDAAKTVEGLVYLYFDYTDMAAGESRTAFDEIAFSGALTNADNDEAYKALADFDINAIAYAVQKDNLSDINNAFETAFPDTF